MEGRILAGRYRLVSQLGMGGMGSLWRAVHLELGTPAAVKLMDSAIAESPEALARFRREAQAAASLRSVNVVQILDYGVDDRLPFIAMELLEGESLGDRLRRTDRLLPAELATLLSQVAKAVGRAHETGIVHRDLKPDNIFLARDGDEELVKVLDFGVAKTGRQFSDSESLKTRTGTMLGTPYYMSPEQTRGQSTVDHRTDIWAIGVIAFECLTGQRPFEGETVGAVALAICSEAMPVPSEVAPVPEGFDAWFARAACRDPDGRYQSVVQAAAELRVICGLSEQLPSGHGVHRSGPPAIAPGETAAISGTETTLQQTGSPSSVTVGGGKRQSVRAWILIGAAAVLGLTVATLGRHALAPSEAIGPPTASLGQAAPGAGSTPAAKVPSVAPSGRAVTSAAQPGAARPQSSHPSAPSSGQVKVSASKPTHAASSTPRPGTRLPPRPPSTASAKPAAKPEPARAKSLEERLAF